MSPLDPRARGMIADAEGTDDPSAEDRGRVRARLVAKLGVTAFGVAAATTAKAAGAGATAAGGGGAMAKVVAVVGFVAVLGAGIVVSRQSESRREHPEQAHPLSTASAQALGSGIAKAPSSSDEANEGHPRSEPLAAGAPGAVPGSSNAGTGDPLSHPGRNAPRTGSGAPPMPLSRANGSAPVSSTGTASSKLPSDDPGDGEAALLRKADAAIDAGNGVAALAFLESHAKQYPSGVLATQRDAARVEAMCTVGRVPAARDAAEAFLASHPRSSRAERIRRACGAR